MNSAERRRLASVALPAAMAILVVVLVVVLALDQGTSGGREAMEPRIGDHWHAPYAIFVERVRLPDIPEVVTPEGVHTHGDGIIHIHPHVPSAEGSGASLASFFAAMGGSLTDTEIRIPGNPNVPGDGSFIDRPAREGKEAYLRILRADSGIHPLGAGFANASNVCNDKPESSFDEVGPEYLPQDGDCIRIIYRPVE